MKKYRASLLKHITLKLNLRISPERLRLNYLFHDSETKKTEEIWHTLRRIMLLSILWKIITTTLLKGIWDRVANKFLKEQVANQSGRSTIEQVLPVKL